MRYSFLASRRFSFTGDPFKYRFLSQKRHPLVRALGLGCNTSTLHHLAVEASLRVGLSNNLINLKPLAPTYPCRPNPRKSVKTTTNNTNNSNSDRNDNNTTTTTKRTKTRHETFPTCRKKTQQLSSTERHRQKHQKQTLIMTLCAPHPRYTPSKTKHTHPFSPPGAPPTLSVSGKQLPPLPRHRPPSTTNTPSSCVRQSPSNSFERLPSWPRKPRAARSCWLWRE